MRVSDKFLHNNYIHPELGLVRVDKILNRVKVEVFVLQRAEGWNEATGEYERYKAYSKTLKNDFSGFINTNGIPTGNLMTSTAI